MSTKYHDAAYLEFGEALSAFIAENIGKEGPGLKLAVAATGEAAVTLIAKRDERIEALERRLAALEGDAK